jgi:predicted KAP-like P-loop ATPase
MADEHKEQYTDDAPIFSRAQDRFSRWPFAERIAHVLATRTDPSSLVIGLYGPWGDGKTSVVNMMAEALATDEGVICVPFNPWHFEDENI